MIGRRMITAGIVALAVGAGGVAGAVIGIPGLSGASSSAPTAGTSPMPSTKPMPSSGHQFRGFVGIGAGRDVLDAAAQALKLSTQDLLQKLSDGKTTIADVAAQQKVDVQTVIDAMQKVADRDISNLVNNPLPMPFKLPLGGSGFVSPKFPGPLAGGLGFGLGFRSGFGLNGSIDAVAKALGITSRQLLSDVAGGQSIAAVAKSKNVDVNTIVNMLVTDATSRIEAAYKAGYVDRARASALEGMLRDQITKLVNSSFPQNVGGVGRIGRLFGPFGFGPGGPKPDAPGAYGSAPAPSPGPASAS